MIYILKLCLMKAGCKARLPQPVAGGCCVDHTLPGCETLLCDVFTVQVSGPMSHFTPAVTATAPGDHASHRRQAGPVTNICKQQKKTSVQSEKGLGKPQSSPKVELQLNAVSTPAPQLPRLQPKVGRSVSYFLWTYLAGQRCSAPRGHLALLLTNRAGSVLTHSVNWFAFNLLHIPRTDRSKLLGTAAVYWCRLCAGRAVEWMIHDLVSPVVQQQWRPGPVGVSITNQNTDRGHGPSRNTVL